MIFYKRSPFRYLGLAQNKFTFLMDKFLNVFTGFFVLCFFVLCVDGVKAVDGAQKWALKTGDKVKSSEDSF